MVNAWQFAASVGRPLNSGLLTVHWRASPLFLDHDWAVLQTKLFSAVTAFLQRAGLPTGFVWTRERANGRGAHTHALVHLGPRPSTIGPALVRHLSQKFRFGNGGIDLSMGRFGSITASMQAGAMRYILKGFDHQAFRYIGLSGETENLGMALGINHRGQQGIVALKRCGTSQNLGPKARRTAGWREVRDVTALGRLLDPGGDTGAAWFDAA
jgi:hypothetical protein